MLHRSRKTKSLRRNQRGAAVRDGDITQRLRQGWPGQVCLRGGTVQGERAGRRGAEEPWASPAGAGRGRQGSEGRAAAWWERCAVQEAFTGTLLGALPPRLDLLITLTARVTLSASNWLYPHHSRVLCSLPE